MLKDLALFLFILQGIALTSFGNVMRSVRSMITRISIFFFFQVTKSMVGAAPITNAGWRLQVTSFILLPGFLWQWFRLPVLTRDRSLQTVNITILGISGVALALHFGLWVSICHSSTQKTSWLNGFILGLVHKPDCF